MINRLLESFEKLSKEALIAGVLVAISVVVFHFLLANFYMPCNPYGDEAWYFYISKKVLWDWDPHLEYLPPIRWAFMLLFHPFTINIWTFRFSHIAISSFSLLLSILIAWRRGLPALVLALAAFLDPMYLFYETHVMTSVVAGALGALSVALAMRGRFALSLIVSILSVGCWEGMAFLYLGMTLLFYRDKRYLLFAIPAALAIATAYDNVLFHSRLPGWSKGPIDLRTLATLITPLGLLLFVYKAYRKEIGDLLVYFALPLGLIANNFVNGTRIELWYQVPAHLIYAVGLASIVDEGKAWKALALITFIFFAYVNVPALKQAVFNRGEPNCCLYEVKHFIQIERSHLILYKPFWAYSSYPFGDVPYVVCWDPNCLMNAINGFGRGYVLSFQELQFPGLKLIYRKGCLLYAFKR
ncbi:hypothetical protein EYM_02620 [Ignicoccus islandicus DSM 13165]|uniref:Uncharacterized protein n=1 Tax=Ignicoccus islandicus DSM 13165 TaxID=940295 RepID=A0A0U3F456_9CREN|nr:hypothetical protein EYM_02620 [Ignicoccus islandicus DSM 13165]